MIQQIVQNSIRFVPWSLRAWVKRLPFIAPLQRRILASWLHGREFRHIVDAGPAKGLAFPVVLPDDKNVWTGTYELDFVTALAAAVKPGAVCFDIGGWRGYCAGTMACSGASKTYVIEPLPANVDRINRMIAMNPKLDIELHQVAVGKIDGHAVFHLMPETSMGKLEDSPFQPDETSATSIAVVVRSLDSLCAELGVSRVDVIKLDVEGAELSALQGAVQILRSHHPCLFVEAHTRALASSVTHLLCELGYEVKALETGQSPDGKTEPDVCHLRAVYSGQ